MISPSYMRPYFKGWRKLNSPFPSLENEEGSLVPFVEQTHCLLGQQSVGSTIGAWPEFIIGCLEVVPAKYVWILAKQLGSEMQVIIVSCECAHPRLEAAYMKLSNGQNAVGFGFGCRKLVLLLEHWPPLHKWYGPCPPAHHNKARWYLSAAEV